MKKIIFILVVFFSLQLNAQNAEGLFIRFGINNGYCDWQNTRNLFDEYSALRPWLTTRPVASDKLGGINLGYGVATERMFYTMDYMSNRNYSRYEGIDSSGTEYKGSYMLVSRTLTLSGGLKIINSAGFRFGIFAGLSANPFVIKHIENEVIKQRAAALFLAGFLAMKWSPSPLDSKFFVSGKVGASMQIGGNYGVTLEPYYVFPFWNADLNSTRFELNQHTSVPTYTENDFKGRLSYWGVRACFFIGLMN